MPDRPHAPGGLHLRVALQTSAGDLSYVWLSAGNSGTITPRSASVPAIKQRDIHWQQEVSLAATG